MEIVRISQPSLEEFFEAARVCELRWDYLKPLHTRERFAMFQELGVELVAARENGRFDGVCFVLPCRFRLGGEMVEWVNLFQLATRPETKNIGALIMLRIMSAYPAIISMGVTEEATRIYQALRWKYYGDVWRGVHPIDLNRMAEDYSGRLAKAWQRAGLRAVAGLYNLACGRIVEPLLSLGVSCRTSASVPFGEPALREKARKTAACFGLFAPEPDGAPFIEAGGIGRILGSVRDGWGTLRQHAAIWKQLRRRGAKFCEVLISSPRARRRALGLGYAPLRMPVWYLEKNGMASKFLDALRREQLSFLHTDKAI